MRDFRNLLFVSRGTGDETQSLKQALSVARANQANLEVLIVSSGLPANLAAYERLFLDSLSAQVGSSIKAARDALKLRENDLPINLKVEIGEFPAIRIIRHVLRNAHDLVIKSAEPEEGGKGFKAVDMELLRKCPCPVWLCRPIEHDQAEIRVAVAIDPISEERAGHDLAIRMLKLSTALAETCSGDLSVLSCWNFPLERYLRGNVWIKMTEQELNQCVIDAKVKHCAALEALIRESNIAGKYHLHALKGRPDEIIPAFVADKKVDILVMGTVARTGIPGFIMGNTAENVLQKVGCSVLAMKPNGFVSSIKAY